jgi:hypothetical protein
MRPILCAAVGVCATVLPGAAVALPGASQPSELVFSSTFAGNREIFASAADGSNRVDLSKDSHADITPAWSADGGMRLQATAPAHAGTISCGTPWWEDDTPDWH